MEEIHRSTLDGLRSTLVKEINPDEELQDHLKESEIFTEQMLERIQAQETKAARCRKMLDMLPQRGENAYEKFLHCLKESGHSHVMDMILQKEAELRNQVTPTNGCGASALSNTYCIPSTNNIKTDECKPNTKPIATINPTQRDKDDEQNLF